MTHLAPNDLLAILNWRYATKQFDPSKTIPSETWSALEDALVLTPSSYGLQPWKFVVITNAELKAQLRSHSWNQAQVTDCSHYVVFAIKKNLPIEHIDRFIESTATTRGISTESLAGYRNLMIGDIIHGPRSLHANEWAIRQTYIALGNFMTSAACLGVDACPMEGIDPPQYDKLLGLSAQGYATVVACAAGYRSETDKYAHLAKVRFPKSEVLDIRC
ncbi:MAG: NAD(P)H-dependent oxidoreductase [Merismopediaceae bacterium]|nr:NAD(P)H-dependent oxidoreductase [Merismopediaceae bacterium]